MLEAFFPAAALLELFFTPTLRAGLRFEDAFFEDALAVFLDDALERDDVLPAAFFEAPPLFAAAVDLERLETADVLERERPRLPPAPLSPAASALTSLLKLLFWPPAVSSWKTNAKPRSSNFWKKSSQEMGSRLPAPLYPGKSIRKIPMSSAEPVFLTCAGFPPRSSAHLRISSCSRVVLERFAMVFSFRSGTGNGLAFCIDSL
ncbi:MAG: hypothetical protein ACR2IV_08975 [Bryobacteraceae bacterium]